MKRHPSLHPLSREHHMALMLAQGAREGGLPKLRELLPEDPRELAAHVLAEWDAALAPHFLREEEVLAPAVRGRDAEVDRLLDRMEAEHRALEAKIGAVSDARSDAGAAAAALTAFSEALIDHVRFEERELFEVMQERLPGALLEALADELG